MLRRFEEHRHPQVGAVRRAEIVRIEVFGGAVGPGKPDRLVAEARPCLGIMAAQLRRRHLLEIGAEEPLALGIGEGGNAVEHQSRHPLGMTHPELQPDRRAGVGAEQRAGGHADRRQRLGERVGEIGDGEGLARQRVGQPEPRRIECEHRVIARQMRDFLVKQPRIGGRRVDQHRGRPVTGTEIMHAARADLEEAAAQRGIGRIGHGLHLDFAPAPIRRRLRRATDRRASRRAARTAPRLFRISGS